MKEKCDLKKVLDLAARMAVVLLGGGAEISRVEETLQHVARHFNVEQMDMFVIANGLFINMQSKDENENVRIRYVPNISANMRSICEINRLSRALEKDEYSLDEAFLELEKIENYSCHKQYLLIIGSGLGAGSFCCLFGGNMLDCFGATICGLLLWCALMLFEKMHLSRVLINVLGAFIVTSVCIIFSYMGLVEHFDQAIMGAIIPLVPGVAFMNGVRDIADGDYISGGIRMIDAVMICICIAAGVGIALKLLSGSM